MPYPKNLIKDGETVALDLRPHWWYFSRHILTGIPLLILVLILELHLDDGRRVARTSAGSLGVVAIVVGDLARSSSTSSGRCTYFVVTEPARDLPHRRALDARRGDPARADQQHQLPPADLRPDHRRRRSRHRVGRRATGSARSTSSAIPTACSRRSTARWRRANDAADAAAASGRCPLRRTARRPRCPSRSSSSRTSATRATSRAAEYEQKKAELLERM